MTTPTIGSLRRRLTLEAASRTSDGAGGAFETWLPVAQLFASMRAVAGNESAIHDRISSRVTHEFWLRARADISPSMRFRLGSRLFHIHAVLIADAQDRMMRCVCEERDL